MSTTHRDEAVVVDPTPFVVKPAVVRRAIRNSVDPDQALEALYNTGRLRQEVRRFVPLRLYWGTSEQFPEEQWLLQVVDLHMGEHRIFPLAGLLRLPVGDGLDLHVSVDRGRLGIQVGGEAAEFSEADGKRIADEASRLFREEEWWWATHVTNAEPVHPTFRSDLANEGKKP